MMLKRSGLVLMVVSGGFLAACHPSASGRSGAEKASAKEAGPVIADVAGQAITLSEVDFRAAGRLATARQEEYEARLDAAKALVAERLIAAEAKSRKMSPDDLVYAEVDEKVEGLSSEEIQSTYEANKSRFSGQTREQALATVEKILKAQRRAARDTAFRKELLDKAGVKINLVPPRQETGTLAGAPSEGPAKAKVTLVEFTDYQCPYCRRAEEAVSTVLKDYQDKVRFVHADFPLSFHERAMAAARAVHCAGDQGKFFAYRHEILMEPGSLSDDELEKQAGALGLDAKVFSTCIQSDRHDAAIQSMVDQGERFGVDATPTFFVNGRKLTGAPSVETLRSALDEELAQAGG
jgi:protein-disulfide isomerase